MCLIVNINCLTLNGPCGCLTNTSLLNDARCVFYDRRCFTRRTDDARYIVSNILYSSCVCDRFPVQCAGLPTNSRILHRTTCAIGPAQSKVSRVAQNRRASLANYIIRCARYSSRVFPRVAPQQHMSGARLSRSIIRRKSLVANAQPYQVWCTLYYLYSRRGNKSAHDLKYLYIFGIPPARELSSHTWLDIASRNFGGVWRVRRLVSFSAFCFVFLSVKFLASKVSDKCFYNYNSNWQRFSI